MSLDLNFINNMNKDVESIIQDYLQSMEDFDKHKKKMKKVNKEFYKKVTRCEFCQKPLLWFNRECYNLFSKKFHNCFTCGVCFCFNCSSEDHECWCNLSDDSSESDLESDLECGYITPVI